MMTMKDVIAEIGPKDPENWPSAQTIAEYILHNFERLTGKRYTPGEIVGEHDIVADIVGYYKLDGDDFSDAWDRAVKGQKGESMIREVLESGSVRKAVLGEDGGFKGPAIDEMIEELEKAFPDAWFRDEGEYILTGEGSDIKGLPLIDYYEEVDIEYAAHTGHRPKESTYEFGIHRDLIRFCEERGWRPEVYDPGTVHIYREE